MNKHGQTLILFVILIPIILILLATIVDIGLVMSRKIKLEEVTKSIIKAEFNNDDKILELFEKNKIDKNNIKITHEENKIKIVITEDVKSIFGSIIGIKKYNIKVSVNGILENEKIIFE